MLSPKQDKQMSDASPNRMLRTQKSFKQRFNFDDDAETVQKAQRDRSRSPARRNHTHFAPFNPFRTSRPDNEGPYGADNRVRRRHQRSSSPDPPPVIHDLQRDYSKLRIALHSNAMNQLEAVQTELTTEVVAEIKTNQLAIARLSASYGELVSPVREAKANHIVLSPGGRERSEVVDMSVAETAHLEIEGIRKELVGPLPHVDRPGETTEVDGPAEALKLLDQEHSAAVDELSEDMEALQAERVGEYKRYEKEFLRRIEHEARKIVNPFLPPGL
ncbi:hypothetical protein JX265_004331 [Neoarthrinium moseri]|uniref:Uncharacterized protein n=1 Tax=Neoarthrinium moseri TaxID=1658444 RepID=A0A9P9WQQ4_9PEZI|nr:uncharacterized protein JN550_001875 [Neoarthrinium moseri]KAI1850621.1 hypothetical protein JX266_003903 [Neoarthrinium moseri]KAI1875273.1 hypothetical protein JX265_004331 [Neoarthrinium moseri]KAI1875589.1 hypothetical protein JN550_001875 [Neoarthrinium moseri]